MTAPTEESKEQELNLSDIIHTLSPSPAPRSQFQSTPQTPIQNTPSSVPVLTLVCKRTNQPITPPIRMHGLSNSPETSATNATSELAPEVTPPSPPPQLHQDLDGIPQLSYRSGISPLSSSISPIPPPLPPAFPLSDLQQAHATITHLAQQLTLLRHQRDLLTHQRDIFIAQKEEEREKHEAEKVAWERLAEALIAQNAKETTAGVGRKAVEVSSINYVWSHPDLRRKQS
ncbi:hypothetical protein BC629DRAFT_835269 [Irpex lacteus]|nr:hypothetical protein BC629DRAFT_835269 [Irpex lacteus]